MTSISLSGPLYDRNTASPAEETVIDVCLSNNEVIKTVEELVMMVKQKYHGVC